MAATRLWEGCFVLGGTVDNFTNDLCAKLSTATPHANSPKPWTRPRNRSPDPFRRLRLHCAQPWWDFSWWRREGITREKGVGSGYISSSACLYERCKGAIVNDHKKGRRTVSWIEMGEPTAPSGEPGLSLSPEAPIEAASSSNPLHSSLVDNANSTNAIVGKATSTKFHDAL
jgi:hypothetical protein